MSGEADVVKKSVDNPEVAGKKPTPLEYVTIMPKAMETSLEFLRKRAGVMGDKPAAAPAAPAAPANGNGSAPAKTNGNGKGADKAAEKAGEVVEQTKEAVADIPAAIIKPIDGLVQKTPGLKKYPYFGTGLYFGLLIGAGMWAAPHVKDAVGKARGGMPRFRRPM